MRDLSRSKGFGRQKGHTESYRGSEYTSDFLPKIRVEIVLPDNQVSQAVKEREGLSLRTLSCSSGSRLPSRALFTFL